jgi:multidrug efflux system membrane fusion protein
MADGTLGREIASPPRLRRTQIAIRAILIVLLIGAGGVLYHLMGSSRQHATAPAAALVPVKAGAVTARDMPIWLSGIGAVQPINMVTVKPRIDGQLESVSFTEGQVVHAGDVLAQIDPRPFQAQLDEASANRAKDEAQLANARLDLGRANKLARMGAGTAQNADTLQAQVAQLAATVQADQAMIDTARLNLEFCTVTSPLTGRVGMRLVDPGAIVHASDPNGLVTVTQMQPIAVLFSLPQDDLPEILAGQAHGQLPVTVDTRNGARHLADGRLVFIDSQVDQANGEVRLKADFANHDGSLWPGQFVTARVRVRTDHAATVVPDRAVLRGENGPYVYLVQPNHTVTARQVKTGHSVDGFIEILSGIAPGETVVFDGQSRLAPGVKIDLGRSE